MSDHASHDAANPAGSAEKSSGGGLVTWIAVGVISAGLGSALPFMLAGQSHAAPEEEHASEDAAEGGHEAVADDASAHSAASTKPSAKKSKKSNMFSLPKEEETVFLPFADPGKDQGIVVNLDEGRMSRYLRVAITMQIPMSVEEDFKKRVEAKRILLRNWLLSKISDLDLEDIRGAAGQNRLRREIRDHFNSVLCPDGYDQIYDVLFEEFNVQ